MTIQDMRSNPGLLKIREGIRAFNVSENEPKAVQVTREHVAGG